MSVTPRRTPSLPPEILQQIFAGLEDAIYLAEDLTKASAEQLRRQHQYQLWSLTLVSRSFYSAAIALLYEHPKIIGANFDAFVAAICPSINSHIRHNGLADLVRVLDMSMLVHNGQKSLTARLLGRVKGGVESFIAPQATFGISCLAPLSKCLRLKSLNLVHVSEALSLTALFGHLQSLPCLETLHVPHAFDPRLDPPLRYDEKSKHISQGAILPLPSVLQNLHITGSLPGNFLVAICPPPATLTHLTVRDAPKVHPIGLRTILSHLSTRLISLTLGPDICNDFLDNFSMTTTWQIFENPMTRLRNLHIGHELLGRSYKHDPSLVPGWDQTARRPHQYKPFTALPNPTSDPPIPANKLPQFPILETLSLLKDEPRYHHRFIDDSIRPITIWHAIDRGLLPHLHTVRVANQLGWAGDYDGYEPGARWLDVRDLDDLLKAQAREAKFARLNKSMTSSPAGHVDEHEQILAQIAGTSISPKTSDIPQIRTAIAQVEKNTDADDEEINLFPSSSSSSSHSQPASVPAHAHIDYIDRSENSPKIEMSNNDDDDNTRHESDEKDDEEEEEDEDLDGAGVIFFGPH